MDSKPIGDGPATVVDDTDPAIYALTELINSARKLLVFTGAGSSAESGIPTYRSGSGAAYRPTVMNGFAGSSGSVWDTNAPLTYRQFMAGSRERRTYWDRSKRTWPVVRDAAPNAGHRALAVLDWRGQLDCVVTQNIDGLHQAAGVTHQRVIELHGNAHSVRCLSCGATSDRGIIQERVEAGDLPPACRGCGGILKPTTILFGEPLPDGRLSAARDFAADCNVCLVIGSSLTVQPAASIPRHALSYGAQLAVINTEATWLDRRARVVVRGQFAHVMHSVVACLTD